MRLKLHHPLNAYESVRAIGSNCRTRPSCQKQPAPTVLNGYKSKYEETLKYSGVHKKGFIMIISDAKRVAEKALRDFTELIPDAKYVALEGIEKAEEKNAWNVIIGYVLFEDIPQTALAGIANQNRSRRYKLLVLEDMTLNLIKMVPYDVAA